MRNKDRVLKLRRHSSRQAFIQVKGKRHYLGPFGSALAQQQFDRWRAALRENR